MTDAVTMVVEQGVATITLNRPDQMNAINYELMMGLAKKVAEAAGDPEVGAVILTGNGKCFCAGGDVKQGARPPADQAPKRPGAEVRSAYLRRGVEASRLLYEMPKPTIAMINGPVVGGGIGMIAACDLRFASEGASFQCGYDRIGGSGDYGATWHWTRILGSAKARELFFLGNKFSAAEALDFGLYHRVYAGDDLLTHTLELSQKFAAGCGASWAYTKANLNAAENQVFSEHLNLECNNQTLATAAFRAMRKAQKENGDH